MSDKRNNFLTARERILQASAELFSRAQEPGPLTVEIIASRAGVSRATFYHHYSSKKELLSELSKSGVSVNKAPSFDRRRLILESALRLIAQQGLHATTMEQIAAESGITKGAIYWHFKDKDELFQSAIKWISPLLSLLPTLEEQIDNPPEEVLPLIARAYLRTFDNPDAVRLLRILLSEAPRMPDVGRTFGRVARPALDFLVKYLGHQTDLGRLKAHDNQTSARIFIGGLLQYLFARELFPFLSLGSPDSESYVKNLVSILLQGIKIPGNVNTNR